MSVTGDELLVATGRTPNSDTLNVEAAGVETVAVAAQLAAAARYLRVPDHG